MAIEITNAVIKEAVLTIEDHDLLTAWLMLDYGDSSAQGFGGWALAPSPTSKYWPGKANYAGVFVRRVLDVVGVRQWDQLKGKTIRAKREHNKVHAIGNIIKDDWFDPKTIFEKMELAE